MYQRDYDRLNEQHREQLAVEKAQDQIGRQKPFFSRTERDGYQITTTTAIKAPNDHIYLNVVVIHSALVPLSFSPPSGPPINFLANNGTEIAVYDTTKTTPILDKSSDYYCAVIRFTIPLDEVPLQIMPIIPNQGNPNLTPFFVGFTYAGISYYNQLIYVPPNVMVPPVQNQPFQVITPYYYVYDYRTLITMINVGLAAAFAASPLPGLIGGTALAPYIFLDPATSLFSLIVQPYFTAVTSPLTSLPTIYVNSLLQTYIGSFSYNFLGYNHPFGNDFEFILTNPIQEQPYYPPNFGISPGTNAILFYKYTQEYPTLQYWSSIRKIVITSAGIPINSEAVPSFNNGDTNVSFPIISDYVPAIEGRTGESRTIAYYLPSAQYRYVDLLSDTPLQKVDLKFFWQDRLGHLYPINISPYQQIEVKIVFVRKDSFKNNIGKY